MLNGRSFNIQHSTFNIPRLPSALSPRPSWSTIRRPMEQTLHHLLATWMQFVLDWGYVGIFVMMALESTAVPMPAEIVIPPAAYWAAQGKFHIAGVVLAATAGSWAGSAIS